MKNYECKLGKFSHLLENPIVELPCGYFACLKCALDSKDYFNNLTCKLCGKNHTIDENFLQANQKINFSLRMYVGRNFFDIVIEKKDRLHVGISNLRDFLSCQSNRMCNLFEFLEDDITLRVESLKHEFELKKSQMFHHIDSVRADISDELQFANQKKIYLNTVRFSKSRSKPSQLLRELPKIRADLHKSKSIVLNLIAHLESYQPSTKPLHRDKPKLIGVLKSVLKPLAVADLPNTKPTFIQLVEYLTNLTSLCQLDDGNILTLDNYVNTLVLFDENFGFIKSVCLNDMDNVRRSKLTFNSNLYGISAGKSYVYVNNMEKNEIIILDKQLISIKRIFSPLGTKSLFEIETHGEFVFVLDGRNQFVNKFDQLGNLVSTIHLEMPNIERYAQKTKDVQNSEKYINILNSFTVSDDVIVSYRPFVNEINVHAMDGTLRNMIELAFEGKVSLCLASGYLLCYSSYCGAIQLFDGRFVRGERSNTPSATALRRRDLKYKKDYHYISCHKKLVFFNNRLFILFSENCSIAIIEC